ncbi:GNAT family N-acetyltransferase [Celerinatantimonas sp. YJH-8]|uniref:GNAT family N-acetyltransferase n=1 Tax=Celerinatantimonas sp. YJH-8 TaxID=3228714 RepID=UPI0038BEFD6C
MNDLMQLYNQHERIQLNLPDFQKIESPEIVKFVSSQGGGSFISYYNFPKVKAETLIAEEVRFFKRLAQPFEWKVYSNEPPVGLAGELLHFGFRAGTAETLMVCDLSNYSIEPKNDNPHVVNIRDSQGIRLMFSLLSQVWHVNFEHQQAQLIQAKRTHPEDVQIYVAYAAHVPAACGWIVFNRESAFASLWGGTTLPQYRGRGLYRAILRQRLHDAAIRGIRYVAIEASAMSRPIVEDFGFKPLSFVTPYFFYA